MKVGPSTVGIVRATTVTLLGLAVVVYFHIGASDFSSINTLEAAIKLCGIFAIIVWLAFITLELVGVLLAFPIESEIFIEKHPLHLTVIFVVGYCLALGGLVAFVAGETTADFFWSRWGAAFLATGMMAMALSVLDATELKQSAVGDGA